MKSVYLLFFLFLLPLTMYSQSLGLNFTLASPQKEFRQNVDNLGFGGSAQFLLWTPGYSRPFSVGLNLGFINYGNESRNTGLSENIPDVTVDVTRSNNLAHFHLMFQICPVTGPVRPYIETLFGGEYLFTTTKIQSEVSGEEVVSSTNQDDFAWSYGAGAGLQIRLLTMNQEAAGEFSFGSLWLDLKARYLFGTEAEYLKEGSVTITRGKAYYNTSKSKTDLLLFHIGVVLQID